ncbi:MAG TPA: YfiR family protein [Terriglobales bacterium]
MAVLIQGDAWFGQNHAGISPRTAGAYGAMTVGRRWWWPFLILCFVLISAELTHAQRQPTEYEIKAAFVYNFAKFVEWPPEAFSKPSDSVRLCVLGNHSLASDLQQLIAGKTIGTRAVEVQRVSPLQITGCHVLFVGTLESWRLQQVLESARGTHVLTVGDIPGFIEQGGVINFILDQNRIRFEVNLKAAQDAGLKLSSKLLSLAKAVEM